MGWHIHYNCFVQYKLKGKNEYGFNHAQNE